MSGVASLWRSTIGKKYVMAVSGILLLLWIIAHAAGNLKIFDGAESFNQYSEWLHIMGAPALGESQALWIMRILLLVLLAAHVTSFVALWKLDVGARRTHYKKFQPEVFSFASRTMRWGGIAVFLFVIYHILHLTTGHAHRDFIAYDPYHNVVTGFQSPLVSGIYIFAVIALGMHLYHGIWSAFQTLGLNNARYNRMRRPVAAVVAVAVVGMFIAIPLGVLVGVIQ